MLRLAIAGIGGYMLGPSAVDVGIKAKRPDLTEPGFANAAQRAIAHASYDNKARIGVAVALYAALYFAKIP